MNIRYSTGRFIPGTEAAMDLDDCPLYEDMASAISDCKVRASILPEIAGSLQVLRCECDEDLNIIGYSPVLTGEVLNNLD